MKYFPIYPGMVPSGPFSHWFFFLPSNAGLVQRISRFPAISPAKRALGVVKHRPSHINAHVSALPPRQLETANGFITPLMQGANGSPVKEVPEWRRN